MVTSPITRTVRRARNAWRAFTHLGGQPRGSLAWITECPPRALAEATRMGDPENWSDVAWNLGYLAQRDGWALPTH